MRVFTRHSNRFQTPIYVNMLCRNISQATHSAPFYKRARIIHWLPVFILFFCVNLSNDILAQGTDIDQEQIAVQLSAVVQVSPPKITLHWKDITWGPPAYTKIYRKSKNASSWGNYLDSLPYTSSLTSYEDLGVVADSAYEYRVTIGGGYTSCPLNAPNQTNSGGYIYAGINAPAIHRRGTLILLVENNLSDSCASEIKTLMDDISGDGWQIIRHNFSKTVTDVSIKSAIINDYTTHTNVKAVLILGHLAVPYSGDIKPDAHPEHQGAWPADVYYADMDGEWTDTSVTSINGTYAANHNIPGDGKWDQSIIPSALELQIGRIDLSDMPAFSSSEVQLMKNYLAKDHAYKMHSINIRHRGALNDALPANCGEGYSANAYRNWAPLIGKDSISVSGYEYLIPFMAGTYPGSAGGYQWVYGSGGGTFDHCAGIGYTSDFVGKPNHSIFSMYFGSNFGDWNVQNNFLRASLCQNPPTLTTCWVSRPNWFFHHMALGENIGYSTRLTQNNRKLSQDPFQDTTYSVFQNRSSLLVSVALMGDITLRTDYLKPISNLVISTPSNNDVLLQWTASAETGVLGYYVYRADSAYGDYQLLTGTMLSSSTYHDLSATDGLKYYMVRPVKLQTTPSGTYYNLGIGIADSINITSTVSAIEDEVSSLGLSVYPNPSSGHITINFAIQKPQNIIVEIIDILGKTIFTEKINQFQGEYSRNIDLSNENNGIYCLLIYPTHARLSCLYPPHFFEKL